MDVEATTFAIADRFDKAVVSFAKDVGWGIDKAFAVTAFLAKLLLGAKHYLHLTHILWKRWQTLVAC